MYARDVYLKFYHHHQAKNGTGRSKRTKAEGKTAHETRSRTGYYSIVPMIAIQRNTTEMDGRDRERDLMDGYDAEGVFFSFFISITVLVVDRLGGACSSSSSVIF